MVLFIYNANSTFLLLLLVYEQWKLQLKTISKDSEEVEYVIRYVKTTRNGDDRNRRKKRLVLFHFRFQNIPS